MDSFVHHPFIGFHIQGRSEVYLIFEYAKIDQLKFQNNQNNNKVVHHV